jgi:hypothetical protein
MRKLVPLSGGAGLAGLLIIWLAVFASPPASVGAFSSGISGHSQTGCSCHGSTADTNVSVAITGPASVVPNSVNSYTVTVSGNPTGSTGLGGGLDVSVNGGALAAGANTQVLGGDITHLNGNSRSWTFSWTAPATAGSVSMFAAGNSVNLNGNTSGDGWNLTNLAITVGAAAAPTNTPVSAATSTPTPTNTPVSAATSTPTPTNTPVSAATSTPTPTNTPVSAATNTPTPTNTSVPAATSTPTPTNTPLPAATSTPTPPLQVTPTPTPTEEEDEDDDHEHEHEGHDHQDHEGDHGHHGDHGDHGDDDDDDS